MGSMSGSIPKTGEQRLQGYLSRLAEVVGHADRKERIVGYCTGLLLPGERKGTVKLMPAITERCCCSSALRFTRQPRHP